MHPKLDEYTQNFILTILAQCEIMFVALKQIEHTSDDKESRRIAGDALKNQLKTFKERMGIKDAA